MSAGVTAAQHELVAAGQPTHQTAAARLWVPVESESRLEVIVVSTWYRTHDEARVVVEVREHRLIVINQITNRLAGVFVTESERESEV